MSAEFHQKIAQVINKDPRYKPDAYEFVMQALSFTQKKLIKKGHVTGKELLEGIREYVLELYGPMARIVLEHWGIKNTSDFGEIVFNLVESGLMSKTEEDSRADFKDVYDFSQALDVFKNKN